MAAGTVPVTAVTVTVAALTCQPGGVNLQESVTHWPSGPGPSCRAGVDSMITDGDGDSRRKSGSGRHRGCRRVSRGPGCPVTVTVALPAGPSARGPTGTPTKPVVNHCQCHGDNCDLTQLEARPRPAAVTVTVAAASAGPG